MVVGMNQADIDELKENLHLTQGEDVNPVESDVMLRIEILGMFAPLFSDFKVL